MPTGSTSRIRLALLILGLVAIFSAIYIYSVSPKTDSREAGQHLSPIRLAVFHLYASAMVVAADQSKAITPNVDCFREAGLQPIILKRSKGPEIVDALVSGSSDFGTLALTPIVLQSLQGSPLVIFSTIQETNHDIKVIARKSAGITSGASLKGKRLGFVGGTFGEIFLNRYLAKHGLDRSQVVLTSSGPAQLRDLFLGKSLDGIIIWEPVVQDILVDPSVDSRDIFLDVDTTLYTGTINLVARPDALSQQPEKAKQLVKAMLCGEDLIHKYPTDVRARLEQWLERKPGTLARVFDSNTFRLQLKPNQLLNGLREEIEWAQVSVFNGKGRVPKDLSQLIDTSILRSVAPDRVKR